MNDFQNLRGRASVARVAHNHEVAGSIPAPVTNLPAPCPENREGDAATFPPVAASISKASVVARFNGLFGWSFPMDSNRESLATMKEYSKLRGQHDLAAQIETVLQT